ncbi:hypothetical protein K438DRAFT_1924902, partial [Mycena galopus ATCC 62051]
MDQQHKPSKITGIQGRLERMGWRKSTRELQAIRPPALPNRVFCLCCNNKPDLAFPVHSLWPQKWQAPLALNSHLATPRLLYCARNSPTTVAKNSKTENAKPKKTFVPYDAANVPDIMPFPPLALVVSTKGGDTSVPVLSEIHDVAPGGCRPGGWEKVQEKREIACGGNGGTCEKSGGSSCQETPQEDQVQELKSVTILVIASQVSEC